MENRQEQERQQAVATLNHQPIEAQLKDLENAVLSGWVSGLEAVIAVKRVQSLLDTLKKNILDSAKMEAMSFPTGYTSSTGKVELRNTATRYSFKHIDVWNKKREELKVIEALSKAAMKTDEPIYNAEGEQIERPEISGGGESLFITLKK